MIWGFLTYTGNLKIFKIEKTLNSAKYLELLQGFFMDEMDKLNIDVSKIIFQQDNAPPHKAKCVNNWFKAQNISLMDWPPQSPDLNIIENVWNYLDVQVRK